MQVTLFASSKQTVATTHWFLTKRLLQGSQQCDVISISGMVDTW